MNQSTRPRIFAALILIVLSAAAQASAADPRAWSEAHKAELLELYKHFHQNPEVSYREEKTAARMADELRKLGAEVTTGVGGTGVVALLRNGDGPTIMFRADMDALPVKEQTGLVYASQATSRDDQGNDVPSMHACGHDIHMTSLIGTAQFLATHRDAWSGTVMFLCQPAEERGGGARAMLDDKLFERFPKPELALALHVDATLATGKIGYRAGYTLANVDSVDVTIIGRGGHGAYPHTTIDPVVMAAQLVLDLQTIVSREIEPTQPAVVTVGSIHGGTKHNIIGDRCELQITCRSYTDEVRQHLLDAIARKAKAVAAASGAPEPKIKISEGTPAMYNDDKLVERVLPSLKKALGAENLVVSEQSMGGEDFSQYGRAGVPIFMFQLGSVDAQRLAGYARVDQPPPSLHSPIYYPDAPETLVTGVTASATAILDLLPPKK